MPATIPGKALLLLLVLCVLAGGCGSSYNIGIWGNNEAPTVYGGLVFDIGAIQQHDEDFPVALWLIWLDLPFTFIGDTILFPVLLVLWLSR